MNFSAIFPSDPNHTSDWGFPPPVDPGFLFDFYTERKTHWQDSEVRDKIFVVEAARNKSAQYGAGDRDGGRGWEEFEEGAIVHVGDVLGLEWRVRGVADDRIVEIECRMCSLGPNEGGSGHQKREEDAEDEDGEDKGDNDDEKHTDDEVGGEAKGIFTACDGYSDSHVSDFLNHTHSISRDPTAEYAEDMTRFDYKIPSLYREIDIPDRAVGVCVLLLRDSTEGEDWDYTSVFAVRQSKRATPKKFSATYPQGVEDPSIAELDEHMMNVGEDNSGSKPKGFRPPEIGGIILGVLLGVGLSLGVVWWVRRRRKRRSQKDAGVECREGGEELVDMGPRGRAQRGGVVRDVETERDDDGEVPPAYHEVVNMKKDDDF